MSASVNELLEVPFVSRYMDDKLKIVVNGKPRPPLHMSAVTINETDGSMLMKQFDSVLYDQVEWLTGCDVRKSLFCWPCLLFKTGDMWSTGGVSDLILLEEGIPKHEKSPSHMEAVTSLKTFIHHHVQATDGKRVMLSQQEDCIIGKNQEIVKLLTEAVCGVIVRDIPTRFQRKTCCRLEIENCVKTLQFLRIYNTPYTNHIDDAIALIQKSPDLLDDIADSITEVLRMEIKKDMESSLYVSIIISEHSESCKSSQISTILRYLKDGEAIERFVGFTNMGKRSTPAAIFSHISKVSQEFEFADRFLAISVDGGVFKEPNELNHLIRLLKTNFPHSYFVPCYFHGLHHVLQQNLSSSKECFKFFKMFRALEAFFQVDSNKWKAFESFMCDNMRNLQTNYLKELPFLKLVNTHRAYFIRFLSTLEQNSKFWCKSDIAKACGFKNFLADFDTVFLLKVFSVLFEHTNTLETSLKSRTPENAFGTGIVTMVIGDLALEKAEGFENLWSLVNREANEGEEPACKKVKSDDTATKMKYRSLFTNIFQRSIAEIQTRFNKLNTLQFCRLLTQLTGEKVHVYTNLGNNQLPKSYRGDSLYNDYLQRLLEVQRPFFEEEQLRNEIATLRSINSSIFWDKSDYDILKLLRRKTLQNPFKNLYRLAELILTMPFRMPVIPNKFENILNFSYTPEKMLAPGDVSVLHLEKDLLHYIKRSVYFYDEVMRKFQEINNTVELIQK